MTHFGGAVADLYAAVCLCMFVFPITVRTDGHILLLLLQICMLQYVFTLAVKTYGTHFVAAVAYLYAAYKQEKGNFKTIFEHFIQNHQVFRGKIMLCHRREKCGKFKLLFR